jgi:hypothetical protein
MAHRAICALLLGLSSLGLGAGAKALMSAAAETSAGAAEAAAAANASAASYLSREGLQGRRARLFAEERARHVELAAKWVVEQALDAAALGDSEVTIVNVVDLVPTPEFFSRPESLSRSHIQTYYFEANQLLRPLKNRLNSIGLLPALSYETMHGDPRFSEQLAAVSKPYLEVQRLKHEIDELSQRGAEDNMRRLNLNGGDFGGGRITLTPKVLRELEDEKRAELDAAIAQMRRPALQLAQTQAGLISRSCLADVASAVAAALPGVSVEVEGPGDTGLRLSWEGEGL